MLLRLTAWWWIWDSLRFLRLGSEALNQALSRTFGLLQEQLEQRTVSDQCAICERCPKAFRVRNQLRERAMHRAIHCGLSALFPPGHQLRATAEREAGTPRGFPIADGAGAFEFFPAEIQAIDAALTAS